MRVAADRLAQATRIARRIANAGCDAVVFFDHKGRLDSCAALTERHTAMMAFPDFSTRIVGVFSPGCSAAMLLSEAY